MALVPVGDRLVVNELTAHEKEGLGYPVGTSGSLDAGIVMAIGDGVEIAHLSVGDRVYYSCSAPKVGTETHVIDGGCVIAFLKKEDL